MAFFLASLVNLAADCVWMTVLTFGLGVRSNGTPVVSDTPPGQLPSELDLAEVQAGRMTTDEFRARMAARG